MTTEGQGQQKKRTQNQRHSAARLRLQLSDLVNYTLTPPSPPKPTGQFCVFRYFERFFLVSIKKVGVRCAESNYGSLLVDIRLAMIERQKVFDLG